MVILRVEQRLGGCKNCNKCFCMLITTHLSVLHDSVLLVKMICMETEHSWNVNLLLQCINASAGLFILNVKIFQSDCIEHK